MKTFEKLERLRKLGKVMVSHKRLVKKFAHKDRTFYQNDVGDLILTKGLPDSMTVKEFYLSPYEDASPCTFFSSNGGHCEVRLDYKDQVYYGRADCDLSDPYNKRIGLEIAIGRLQKELFSDHPDLKCQFQH
jgi:hypothetical protein